MKLQISNSFGDMVEIAIDSCGQFSVMLGIASGESGAEYALHAEALKVDDLRALVGCVEPVDSEVSVRARDLLDRVEDVWMEWVAGRANDYQEN